MAIDAVKEGDYVLAKDVDTGVVAYQPVLDTFVRETDETYTITIDGLDIETTAEHPFYCVDDETFVPAKDLEAGDTVETADGDTATVEDVTQNNLDEPVLVYNFEVMDSHTYYVGEDGILVHNTCEDLSVSGKIKQSMRRDAKTPDLKEFDITSYGEFSRHPGDNLSGHELLQNAWLEANEKAVRGKGLSRDNPAIALFEDPMHKFITKKQRSLGLNKANLKGTSWRRNVLDNLEIMKEAGVPREKIAELAWKTREFAINNNL